MKLLNAWVLLLMACCWSDIASAQLQFLPDQEPQRVFAGDARQIRVVWHNTGDTASTFEVRARLYQMTSATAAPLAEKFWKRIEVLPGQTVLEAAEMDFPPVNAETQFLIQWLEGTNRVCGKTEVQVYPTNLLAELKTLMGENVLGALDPNNELKPLLKRNRVDFVDLEETSLDDFHGKLAVIGPFQSKLQMREGLAQSVERIAARGTAVVWIQPPPEPRNKLKPSFYLVPVGKGSVVVVQANQVFNLAGNPRSQLNLIYLSKLALTPEPFLLPDLKTQP
jgi:hypothetical protein